MRLRNAVAFCLITLTILSAAIPAAAARRLSTRASSDYGSGLGNPTNWLLSAPPALTINGVKVNTQTVCPAPDGGIDQATSVCTGSWIFLYQVPSAPSNLVLTFSGLTKFGFNPAGTNSTFGVLICDPTAPATNMLCTNLTDAAVQNLNLSFEVEGGNLIITVPSFAAAAASLTFYIAENAVEPTVELQNSLSAPVLTVGGAILSPPTMAFGSQEAGTSSSPQTMTFTNSADFSAVLDLSSIAATSNFSTSGACPSVAPGSSCALLLSFSPATAGSRSGTFTAVDNSPFGTETATLNGLASTAGVTIAPSNLFFGSQQVGTSSAPQVVTITNAATNAQPLNVTAITSPADPLTGQPDFVDTSDTCIGKPIQPGKSCQASITFSPSSFTNTSAVTTTISGSVTSKVVITDNSVDGSHTVQVTGTANETGVASTSVPSLVFGSQPFGSATAAQTVTFSTLNTAAINIVDTNVTGGFTLQTDQCGTVGSITASASCTESVTFTPTQVGPYTGSLTIAADTMGATVVVPLSGMGAKAPPTVTVTPSQSSIATTEALTVSIDVSGTPTPTGAVALTSGSYASTSQVLSSGSATVTIPAGSLAIGTDTLTATYTPDSASSSTYNSASGTDSITVTAAPPPAFALSNGGNITIAAGASTGNTSAVTATPSNGFTGTVALTCAVTGPSGATNPATCNVTTSVSITGSSAATATLTVTTTSTTTTGAYTVLVTGTSGALVQTTTVNVAVSAPVVAAFALTNSGNITVSPGATTGNTSTITVTPSGGFLGSVALTAALTASPTGAKDLPTFSFGSTSPVSITGASAGSASLTVTTTAATSAALVRRNRLGISLYATGGATLACVLLFGVPRRRRSWRKALGIFILSLFLCGSAVSCGGGGGSGSGGGGGGTGNPGTTAGTYTITVTGTSGSTTETSTLTLTVN